MPLDVDGLDQLMTDIAAMTAQLDMEKGGGRILLGGSLRNRTLGICVLMLACLCVCVCVCVCV